MLKAIVPKAPDIMITEKLSDEAWDAAGNPHMWKVVESVDWHGVTFEAQVDLGYGYLRLMIDGIEAGRSKISHCVISPNCICLGVEYFGCSTYLWF